ncbi:hypothetical protein LQR31_16545 [Chromobacterium vaccinii]|uniref:hypothetical protein n=1 Tax=Chromobacterium vaccinii TaxID=1108595 RepID=UPI001E3559C6|nr:hypothetical protein [Chromobacterium vaccinii]MCD4486084.1 hypothetical protein [Chromobacterium vaccinii]
MRSRLSAVIASWPFLISLLLLLANDWWLKPSHPSWLSGKLSDFAGLMLIGLLLQAAWPRRFLASAAGLALAWLWWKSPMSTPAIRSFNTALPFAIARTVDYGDLIALWVLPLCRLAWLRHERMAAMPAAARRWLASPLALAAVLACVASAVPYSQQYGVRARVAAARLDRAKVIEALDAVAAQYRLRCERCDPGQDDGYYSGGQPNVRLKYRFASEQEVRFDIWTVLPGVFNGSERERLQAMRGSIRQEMARRLPQLDYLEPVN